MKVFALICALFLVAIGMTGHYGWGQAGEGPRTLIAAIPALFGGAMLLGTLIALIFRRTGLELAFIAALAGGFSGLGRLAPSYLKETLDWRSYPLNLIVAMSAVCLIYVLVAGFCCLFVRRKPVPKRVNEEKSLTVKEAKEMGEAAEVSESTEEALVVAPQNQSEK